MLKHRSFVSSLFLLTIFGLLASGVASAHEGDGKDLSNAAPGGSGGSGPYSSSNVNLLSQLELEDIGGGASVLVNDCWGWQDDATGRKFAIVGLTNATSFIEVTDPTTPLYLGKLDTTEPGQNQAWRDIKVYNDHAFIVADGGGNDQGVQAFDLQQLLSVDPATPQSFVATSTYTGFSPSHNIAINEATGHGFVVGARTSTGSRLYRGGLVILDLSDPSNITEVGSFSGDGYTHDAQAVIYIGPDADHFGKEIVFACNEDTLTIVDIATDSSGDVTTSQLSRKSYASSGYSHQGWLSEDHKYFYMNDELDEYFHARGPDGQFGTDDDGDPIPTKTHIWNVQDLDNPVYEGFYEGVEKTIDHNLYVMGDFIYQANYASGLRILKMDPNDPTSLYEYGYFDTYGANNAVSFNGAWSVYPFFGDDCILISDRQGGLFVVERMLEPTVAGVELNIDEPQRSAVESISLRFDGDVVFADGAFSVIQRSTVTEETFEPLTISVSSTFENGETTATVQFESHFRNSENALEDGNYQLTLNAELVTREGIPMSEDYQFGDEESDGFYSYYGEVTGDRIINVFDFIQFQGAYATSATMTNYRYYLDFDANGVINIFDFIPFSKRFATRLPFAFGGSRLSAASEKLRNGNAKANGKSAR